MHNFTNMIAILYTNTKEVLSSVYIVRQRMIVTTVHEDKKN